MFTVFCMLFIVNCHVLILEQRNNVETTPVMAVIVDPYIARYHQNCLDWAWIQEQAIFALSVIITVIKKSQYIHVVILIEKMSIMGILNM